MCIIGVNSIRKCGKTEQNRQYYAVYAQKSCATHEKINYFSHIFSSTFSKLAVHYIIFAFKFYILLINFLNVELKIIVSENATRATAITQSQIRISVKLLISRNCTNAINEEIYTK